MTTFVKRRIAISIQLAQNTQTQQPSTFAESGTSQVNIAGLRSSVRIQNSGSPANCTANVKIWGLTPSLMNQLSTLGLVLNLVPKNIITIKAGDDRAGMSTVFQGTIWSAYGDYRTMPDTPFEIACLLTGANAVQNTVPTSFQKPFDVATAMSGFARQMGAGFQNNGISLTLPPMYFSGSARQQAQRCAEAAGINWGFPNGNVMEIWKKTGNRNNPTVPVISPRTGMIGYPAFTQQGIVVSTLFNPQLAFGSKVSVESSVLAAISQVQADRGNTFPTTWAINKLDLALDAELPGGQWMSTIYGYSPDKSNVILPPAVAR